MKTPSLLIVVDALIFRPYVFSIRHCTLQHIYDIPLHKYYYYMHAFLSCYVLTLGFDVDDGHSCILFLARL